MAGGHRVLGLRLRRVRLMAGLTQRELAALSGVPAPRISLMERGLAGANPRCLTRMSRALGCTTSHLLKPVVEWPPIRWASPRSFGVERDS